MDTNQREKEPDEEFKERMKKLHQQIDETKKAKGVEAERDQLQKDTSLLSSSIAGVPVTRVKLVKNSSAYTLIESTVGFSTIRPQQGSG
jgi:DNA polymerase II small subunit/DNA polymerase delta subunit B